MAFTQTTGLLGVDLNTPTTTQDHPLGTRVLGSDGTLWQYVNAATAVTAYQVVAISTSGTCGKASVADAMAGRQLAFAQNAFAASDYGWVPLNGTGGPGNTMKVMGTSTMTANVALYLTATTGVVGTQVSSSATLAGVYVLGASGSATATTTAYACIITWPKVRDSGL